MPDDQRVSWGHKVRVGTVGLGLGEWGGRPEMKTSRQARWNSSNSFGY